MEYATRLPGLESTRKFVYHDTNMGGRYHLSGQQ